VGFVVPECGDGVGAVVGGVAAAAALSWCLPVFESAENVLDVGPDLVVRPVVVVTDDRPGSVSARVR